LAYGAPVLFISILIIYNSSYSAILGLFQLFMSRLHFASWSISEHDADDNADVHVLSILGL